jgi:PAS domain S-box-containing protein
MKTITTEHKSELLVTDMRRAYRLGAFGLLIIALTIVGLGAFERSLLRSIFESRELMRLARHARLLAVDRETGVRGFLLTGDRQTLEPETAARKSLPAKLDSLVRLTAASPSRRDRAESVQRAVGRWERGYVLPVLADAQGRLARDIQDMAGKELFDGVRAAFASFLTAEERFYGRRVAFERGLVRFSLALILAEIIFVVLMMRRLNRRVVHQARQVMEQQEQLEDQAIELEHQAAELEEQAMQLEEQNDESRQVAAEIAKTNESLRTTVEELERARDETRHLATEREKAQSLLNFVLDSSPVGFGLFDPSLRFTLANEAMAVINDMPASSLIGKSPRDLVSADLAQQSENLLRGVLETGEPVLNVPLSGSISAQPGIERFWLVSYFPVRRGSDQTTIGVGIMVTEVTERKRLEEQLTEA